jgi:hypothetical protein
VGDGILVKKGFDGRRCREAESASKQTAAPKQREELARRTDGNDIYIGQPIAGSALV